MKNAMKKIMSLVLVAMILVSAVPFQASAAYDGEGFYVVPVQDTKGRELGQLRFPVAADGSVKIENSARNAAMIAGYGNVAQCDIEFNGHGGAKSSIDGTLTKDEADSINYTCLVSPKPNGAGDQGTIDVDTNITHLVQFVDSQFKVVASYTVKDGESLRETANADLSKIQASAVSHLIPAGYEFAGWRDVTSTNGFVSSTVYHANTTYMLVTQAVETNNNNTSNNNNSSSNNNTSNNNSSSNNNTSNNSGSSSSSSSNNGNSYNANTGNVTNNSTSYSKFAYPVYLNIYTDTTVGTVKKTINITNGIAADGRVTLSEVKNLVPNYYTADVDATGIIYDGLYPAQGNWVLDYVVDQKYDIIEGLYEAASNNYVYINVMLTNAVALNNTSTSTNPKTGDEIYMAVTGMALSACALAVVFYMTKKRSIV